MFAPAGILISFRGCAEATVEPHLKKNLPGSIIYRRNADGFADQLQHRAEPEDPDHSLRSANAIAFARRLAVGINPLSGEGP
jgi:hypothetical protein